MKHLKYLFLILLLSGCGIIPEAQETPNDTTPETVIESEQVIPPPPALPEIIDFTPYEVSLPALMQKEMIGSDLKLEQILAQNTWYTRYRISYLANGLTISGIMNIPSGDGPFPLLILNHGYIDPDIYTNGRGLKREQDYFARNGFAVLHPDYRNHAFSDKDENTTLNFRLGYTEDVIGAVLAVQNSDLPELKNVDTENVGMLGHSMGGGITQNVLIVQPELIKAAVLYAPVSSDARDNLEQYFLRNNRRTEAVDEIYATHGSPDENPEFWDNISPRFFFDAVQAPVQIHIGTNDDSTSPQWSEDIKTQLEAVGKDVELLVYEEEKHEFIPQWQMFMERSAEFFREHLQSES